MAAVKRRFAFNFERPVAAWIAMAASCPNAVRVRLYFDYPPPAVSDCRMCWVLVDLNKCRVVADLASIIRDKFDFSRRAVLNLFIEDCYLPPAESVYVVRDNDSIRVKVDVLQQVNGCELSSDAEETPKTKKRGREGEEESEDEEERAVKKRKRSAKRQETQKMRFALAEEEMATKKKKKKRKKEMKLQTEGQGGPMTRLEDRPEASTLKEVRKATAPTNCKVVPQKRVSSSSESSDEERPPKTVVPLRTPVQTGSQIPAKTAKLKVLTRDSSSDSSGTAAPSRKPSLQAAPGSTLICGLAPSSTHTLHPRPLVPGSTSVARKQADSSSSDSSSETELVIKRPPPVMQGILGAVSRGRGESPGRGRSPAVGRGVGRGNLPRGGGGPRGGRGQRGPWRAEGQNNSYDNRNDMREQHLQETQTNRAVVLQTPPAAVPPRDYTTMPLLAAPPAVGQTIAFKLLELTESYTPEVSDYKEGKIVGFDQSTKQVQLQLLSSVPAPTGPGKFDLVYQAPDGSEVIEYALSRGSRLTERWESLLEPRLVVENIG
ncbi:coilin [Brienomyrus brachyistius]|uniref:coilin n=1 Tax=Brienomyrus brachyistius TaxID=42636 RepID=UPI0020B33464|nr:coilin [Brienomyrus brachyistius]